MKKRALALFLACLMTCSLLTGCGGSSGDKKTTSASDAVTADGRDADGNIVDLSAYATSLGAQWFTEEDEAIWANIQEKSSNPD